MQGNHRGLPLHSGNSGDTLSKNMGSPSNPTWKSLKPQVRLVNLWGLFLYLYFPGRRKGSDQFFAQWIGIAERGGVVEDIAFSVYFAIEEGLEEFAVQDIKKVLEKSELEVRGEIVKKIKREKKPPFNGTPQKDDFKSTERIELPKTLAQKLAVEDGDGFASTPTTHAPESPAFKPVLVSQDPIKQKRFMMDWHAEECVKLMSPTVQTMVMDILRENRSWKTADVIYFGIQALAEQKKKR